MRGGGGKLKQFAQTGCNGVNCGCRYSCFG